MKDKIICFAICFILAFEPLPAYALDPVSTTLTVVGGTMGTEGLAAIGATGPVAAAAIGVTIAVMAGLHLDSKISQASANAGMTKSAYVQQKISEYCTAKGQTISDYAKAILTTVKISRDGLIYMGKDAADAFTGLFDWLDAGGQLVSQDYVGGVSGYYTGLTSGSYNLNGVDYSSFTALVTSNITTFAIGSAIACNYICIASTSTVHPYYLVSFIPKENLQSTYYKGSFRSDTGRRISSTPARNFYDSELYSYSLSQIDSVPENVPYDSSFVYDAGTSYEALNQYLDGLEQTIVSDRDAITYSEPWEQVKADVQPDEGEAVVVDPHALGAIADSYPAVGDLTISLGDYLDALRKAWDGTIADTIPAVDALTGEEVAIPIPQDLVDSIPADTTVDIVDEDMIDDTTTVPAIDDTVPPSPSDALQGMSVGLDDIFPFCIPFDIYHILQKFNASPETPVVDLQFNSSIIGVAIPLHVDLHDYDGVAQVARTMELVAYVVGLAIITRKTILRG